MERAKFHIYGRRVCDGCFKRPPADKARFCSHCMGAVYKAFDRLGVGHYEPPAIHEERGRPIVRANQHRTHQCAEDRYDEDSFP